MADPQSLLEEKEAAVEKLAISDYELRLALEDISKLKSELQKKTENLHELSGICLHDILTSVSFFLLYEHHRVIQNRTEMKKNRNIKLQQETTNRKTIRG